MEILFVNLGHFESMTTKVSHLYRFQKYERTENLANILTVQFKKLFQNVLEFDKIFDMHGQSWKGCRNLNFLLLC